MQIVYSYRCAQHRLLDRCNVKMNNNAVYTLDHACMIYEQARPCLVPSNLISSKKESCMHGLLNKVYLQNLFSDECNFS